jgi:hypothetical protein
VALELLAHLGGVERLVIGDLDLDHLAPVLAQPIAEPLRVDARDEVEALHPRRDDAASGGLDPEHRLALHQDDVLFGAKQLRDQALGLAKALLEDRVVVEDHRPPLGLLDPQRRHRRARAEREVWLMHGSLLVCVQRLLSV